METTGRKFFNLRGFLILTATLTGLGLPVTGLANHLHQMDPIISFSRHAWMAAHTILGLLFMGSIVFHALLHRRVLLNYVRGRADHPEITREALSALVLVAVMLVAAVGHALH